MPRWWILSHFKNTSLWHIGQLETTFFLSSSTGCLQNHIKSLEKYWNYLSFQFNGVLYNECTWTSAHLTEHKPWCSTFVDETGEILLETTSVLSLTLAGHHVGGQGKWGNCGPGCPIPPGIQSSQLCGDNGSCSNSTRHLNIPLIFPVTISIYIW